jgi:hypothetical protein
MRFNLDTTQIAPNTGGTEIWEAGNYPLVFLDAQAKELSSGGGMRIGALVEAIDGPMKGRKNVIGFNVENPKSPQNAQIAREQWSAMCWAILQAPYNGDTDTLRGKPFVAQAKKTEGGNNWDQFQTINGERAIDVYNRVMGRGAQQPQTGVQGSGPTPQQGPQPGFNQGGFASPPGQAPGGFGQAPQGQQTFGQAPQQAAPPGFGQGGGQQQQPGFQPGGGGQGGGWGAQPGQGFPQGGAAPAGNAPWGAQGGAAPQQQWGSGQ